MSQKPALIAELRRIPLFSGFGDDAAECLELLEHGEELRLEDGERLVAEGEPAAFYVLLEGQIQVRKRLGTGQIVLTHHQPGTFFGEAALMLGGKILASGYAVGSVRVYRVEESIFWRLLSSCPGVARQILSTLAVRMQGLEAIAQSHERLVSLGTMAAGLAHELNNPAAAARRAAESLREGVVAVQKHACLLNLTELSPAQRAYVMDLQQDVTERANCRNICTITLDTITQSDREDAVTDWLERHGIGDGWELAPNFVTAGLDLGWLEEVAGQVPTGALENVLRWVAATITVLGQIHEVESSTGRISTLVKAVKSYSFMDQAPQQQVDLHTGLDDTLTMLGHKLKRLSVVKDFDRSLPTLSAYGSELNQVWTNLIDNAADAAGEGGAIRVRTAREGDHLLVEVQDNGPGIPQELRTRIFEPFFTTKGVGKGTGLGLVTSHRIVVGRHGGDIQVQSQPGDTRFQVRLPLKGNGAVA